MQQVNIHEAKTHLSTLIDKAAKGEPFVIAKAGKPMVTVIPYNDLKKKQQRVGFIKGQLEIPIDFDRMGEKEIAVMFEAAL